MRNKNSIRKIVQFFSSLSDETRIKILLSLIDGPKTVNEIHKTLGKSKITLSAISHQLKQLSNINIIIYERSGKKKIFSLSNKFCWCMLKDTIKYFRRLK